jgi:antitoxin component of MazEF toxin-antitoxin module
LKPKTKKTLEEMLEGVTPENYHYEHLNDEPQGKEKIDND